MEKQFDILILMGPNGVGKTTIGRLLAEKFQCTFLSVEEFFLEHYPTLEAYWVDKDNAYKNFETLARTKRIELNMPIVFEEVGLSQQSQSLINNLQKELDVAIINITADQKLCAQRVLDRGLQSNFPKSPEMLHDVYQRFMAQAAKRYVFDAELVNNDLSFDQIYNFFDRYLTSS